MTELRNSSSSTYYCPMHTDITSSSPGDCPICGISLEPFQLNKNLDDKGYDHLKWRTSLACFLTLPIILWHLFPLTIKNKFDLSYLLIVDFIVATIVVFIGGWQLILKGIQSLNAFSLIASAVLIAYFYSAFKLIGTYLDYFPFTESLFTEVYFEPSAVITTIVLIGQLLEAKVLKKTTKELENLINLAPHAANLLFTNGEIRRITIEDIKSGDVLRVGPGEKIPVDGDVIEGQSWVNEAKITGEVIPVFKRPESRVFTGTLNGNNSFTMVAKNVGEDTVLSGMIQVLASARLSKASIQIIADKMVFYFLISVFLIAVLTGIFWSYFSGSISSGIMHTIAILIIASPIALMLAIPIAMVAGMGLGASRGILVKDASALEVMENVTTLIIDKTGTLTEGKPMLTKIFARFPFSEIEVLKFAASIEIFSDHPLAQSIVMGSRLKQIHLLKATNFQNIEGKGVIGDIENSRVAIGNAQLLLDLSIDPSALIPQALQWQREGLTVSFVALEFRPIGLIAVADPLKFSAERAIQQLKRENIKIVMATGDSLEAASAVAKRLKIDEIHAACLPQDKMSFVQELQNKGEIVAMAGDGITDAPALSQANVSISMNGGLNPNLYNSTINLIGGDLSGVVRTRILSKLTMKTVKDNLFFAIIYNVVAISLAAGIFYFIFPVILTPIIACISMSLSSLFVIGNSLRLKKHTLYD